MTEVKIQLTLEAIRVKLGKTRAEMADELGITLDRYNRLANGESRMFATELVRLGEISGIPYQNIEVIS